MGCDVNYGVVCDDPHNLIEHIEHISHASDCQAICQNHGECNFWSHYRQAEGHEHWGHCLIYYDCTNTVDHECFGDEAHECQAPMRCPMMIMNQGLVQVENVTVHLEETPLILMSVMMVLPMIPDSVLMISMLVGFVMSTRI